MNAPFESVLCEAANAVRISAALFAKAPLDCRFIIGMAFFHDAIFRSKRRANSIGLQKPEETNVIPDTYRTDRFDFH
jgi:hypothetical protein